MCRMIRVIVPTLLLVVGLGQTARAQSPSYEASVDAGIEAYANGQFDDALRHFVAAHALVPNARTHRGIGISALQLKQYTRARHHLRAALAHTDQPLDDRLRLRTEQALALAEAPIARLQVGEFEGSLTVDGAAAELDLETGELLLDPGIHRVEARLTGQANRAQTVTVEAGQRIALTFDVVTELDPVAPVEAADTMESSGPSTNDTEAPGASRVPPRDAPVGPSRLGPIVLLSVGGGALAAAVVTGVAAQRHKTALEEGCPEAIQCDESLESHVEDGKAFKLATNVLLASGGALIGGAVLWWLLSGEGEPTAESTPTAMLSCDRSYCGLQMSGAL